MRTLNRNKITVQICHRIDSSSKVMTYFPPKTYHINFMPIEDESEIAIYGESYTEILKGVADKNYASLIQEFDRVFVEVTPPLEHDKLCENADYQITSVSNSINQTRIIMRRRIL